MNKYKKIIYVVLLASIILPLATMADQFTYREPPTPVTSMYDVVGLLRTLVGWAFTLLMILAIFFIFLAAWNYLSSQGDENKIKTAGNQLIYAIIAIGVALLARGIEFIVRSLVGA